MTADLVADLRAIGVAAGDCVMVHASLRAIGREHGGAPAVLDALALALGPGGTMLMMIGARDDLAWVNTHPEDERAALLAAAVPFDPEATPAEPDNGYLAEAFRLRPGTRVNGHPEGRFAAAGRLAADLVDDPPWHDYYGPGSALERLVRGGGKVLRLGADPGTSTVLHLAEYHVHLPFKRRVRRHRLVVGTSGPEVTFIDCLDDEHGIVDWAGEDYFGLILRDYLAAGHGRSGRVGNADSQLLDAADFVAFGTAWMHDHL